MHTGLYISGRNTIPHKKSNNGFTLIEVLIATSILAIIAMLSWRGIDYMVRTQGFTQQHSNRLLDMQTALAQWRADWDAAVPQRPSTASTPVFDWNGRTLRLLRLAAPSSVSDLIQATQQQNQRSGAPVALTPGLQVVVWTLRDTCLNPAELAPHSACWMRWQSPVLHTLGDQQTAWQQAASWAAGTHASDHLSGSQYITPLQTWKLSFYAQGAWIEAPVTPETAPARQSAQQRGDEALLSGSRPPDAVRLQLTLPAHAVLSGEVTVDWINPTYTRIRE